MDIVGFDVVVEEIFRQFFGHSLGKRRYEHAFMAVDTREDFVHEVVDLIFRRSDIDFWVEQACGTDNLLDDDALGFSDFEVGRRRTDIDNLMNELVELFEAQRSVVECCRQTEAVFYEVLLPCPVAAVHGTNLWHAHMAFVDDGEKVFREEIKQAVRPVTRLPTVEIARIILYAAAMAQFLDHLHVVFHPLLDTLCLDCIANGVEISHAFH